MRRRESITTREYTYTAVFEPEENGGYTVWFPALRGCLTCGATLDEAREMAAEALQGYLEILQEDGTPIPVEGDVPATVSERVRVQLKAV